MQVVQQILFLLLTAAAVFIFTRKIKTVRRNINLGKDETINDQPDKRWRNVLLLALGQKKMFKRPVPAILHFFVYAGFIIINIEILEIILDGLLGHHRLFAPWIGSLYTFLIDCFEILAATVWIACAIFLIRRNILKIKRLNQHELDGWPKSDANLILCTEIFLMSLFLIMNAADQSIQSLSIGANDTSLSRLIFSFSGQEQLLSASHYTPTGTFVISGNILKPLFSGMNIGTLVVIERTCWWMHILGIFAFLNYLPYSKHLHILLAFPNAYYASLEPAGEMKNMDEIQKEVLYMMEPEKAPADAQPQEHQKFGARDIMDLSWKSLLDAYACTECGRCTANCPANITGKKLSPRKIMMDTRDRMEEVGKNMDANKGVFVDDGKALLKDYISVEELRACTTCNACVEACPVSISPLNIIAELRRNLIMEESNAPQEWNMMFSNIENNMAPWKFSPDDRDAWVADV